jgi:flagella basal body P-ring formation protein FlgA
MIRAMIRTLAAFAAFVALAGPAFAQVTAAIDPEHPVLRSEATVTGDYVRIGDLIDHAGVIAKIPIFRAPDIGSTGTVSADAVAEAVRAHALIGLDTAGISEVTVTRLGRPIAAKEIEARIAKALAAQYALGSPDNISLYFDREPRTVNVEPSAKGDLRLDALSYDARNGRFDATLDLPAGASGRGRLRFTGRAAVTVEVAVLARPLSRGETIRQDDIIMQRRPRAEVNGTMITDLRQAAGLAARTSLQAERPLRSTDLMKPELVQRNETVMLVYEVPGIVLTVRGRASEGGAEGDAITVINEQTKRPVQGVIAAPGRVIVGGANPRLAANAQSTPAR